MDIVKRYHYKLIKAVCWPFVWVYREIEAQEKEAEVENNDG